MLSDRPVCAIGVSSSVRILTQRKLSGHNIVVNQPRPFLRTSLNPTTHDSWSLDSPKSLAMASAMS